ncbi:hypothetical protein BX600DRAFT_514279 [Xylariales sp. PMI_506]|nr:hypothetical protein BX600DRAFT_514279 [Xylariales sp. PMI_506]
MGRLQQQQQQQQQQSGAVEFLYEDDEGEDGYTDSGEDWDDEGDDDGNPTQNRIQNQIQGRGSTSASDLQESRTGRSERTPMTTPSIGLSRFPSGSGTPLVPSSGVPQSVMSGSASRSTTTTPRSGSEATKTVFSAAAMSLIDLTSVPNPTASPPTDLPAIDDFMLWMDSVNSNTLGNMLLPHSVSLPTSPVAEDAVQLESLFHKLWPLLHLPTFSIDMATPTLVGALGQLKHWLQQKLVSNSAVWDISSNNKLLQSFMESMTSDISLSSSSRIMSISSFQTVQALGLIASCAITGNNPPAVFEWAIWCADICTAYLRQMGVFQGTRKIEQPFHIADERWIMEEQFNRLAATFLRIDAYLGLILNRAPILRWPEMRFTFPASETIWRAATPEDRRVLLWHEPAGRYSTSFRTIIRDGLMQAGLLALPRPKQLLMEDYNLALCAFFSDVWEVTQEARHHDHRSYKSLSKNAAEGITTWKTYLLDLRSHMEMNCQLETTFFGNDQNLATISPSPSTAFLPMAGNLDAVLTISASAINLNIYHLLHLMMFANIPVLETAKCCEECQDLGLPMRVQMWASGPDGRRAVVHAAQLRRVYEREIASGMAGGYTTCLSEAQQRISNPLRSVALFSSAVVLCSYADRAPCFHHQQQQQQQQQQENQQTMELVQPEIGGHVSDALERWIADNNAPGGLFMLSIPMCRCSVPLLVSWYREQLGPNSQFSQRLTKFETTLQR